MTPVLALEGISKSYGRRVALDGVSLEIGAGEYVGLLGPNGAGKSTLFQIVSGLFVPDAGEVRLFGARYREDAAGILRRIGVVFQARSVDLDMSVRANLRFHGNLFGLSGAALAERIEALAAQFGLTAALGRPVRTLSGGQQQRVEIARALLARPQLLLMDEPSAGLDATSRRDLVAHIRALAQSEGVAILWATHLVDEVEGADRLIVLAKGRKVADGPPGRLMAEAGVATLTDLYGALTGEAAA